MAANGGFGSFRHLALRFFGALDPRGPAPAEEAWAMSWLLPGEKHLWRRMSGPDRRHAAGVAREAAQLLGDDPPRREVMASALLHDVGKVESRIGTFSRVAVTVGAMALGRERLMVGSGSDADPSGSSAPGAGAARSGSFARSTPPGSSPPGAPSGSSPPGAPSGSAPPGAPSGSASWRRRVSDYLTHDRIGAALLEEAGSDGMTVAWAGEHHLPPAEWSVERRVADALKAADGD